MHAADVYTRFAKSGARVTARPGAFIAASLLVAIWIVTGPFFDYSDTWQLVINTGTTIVTFLMVFLIQNTQTRDTEAMQLKLDELIRATQGAQNALLDLEELEDEALDKVRKKYQQLAALARERQERRTPETGSRDA